MLALLAAALMARPLVLAHYMPWYESKPFSGQWGWHWTMNHFAPDSGALASQFHPLIGPYDSADPDALECQCLLMRLSGIDGVLIDWYGINDLYDYPRINRCTELMIREAQRTGLKFGIVYEDQTLTNLIRSQKVKPQDAVRTGVDTMRWLEGHYFSQPGYLKEGGKPVLLVFGPQFYKDQDWTTLFAGLDPKPAFFTELGRKGPSVGAFGWPEPQVGDQRSWSELAAFYARAKSWPSSIGVAYPRFQDIYAQAGIHPSWGTIEDRSGKTYTDTLSMALKSGSPMVQIATWNDWGEGTQIEHSTEFGYRDLEATQLLTGGHFTPADLRLPVKLYELRKRLKSNAGAKRKLDKAAKMLGEGRASAAARLLKELENAT